MRAALWSSEAHVVIANPDASPWAFRTEAVAERAVQEKPLIDAVTMDSLLEDYSTSTGFIVKIDIEGAEREVFSSNTSWLRLVDLLIIELHDIAFPWKGNSRNFFSAIAAMPMDYIWQPENLFCFHIR
jgi:FkbM family methyltransferase